jgi:CubicO group peptidase (beta-lactamase class C family)
MGYPMFFGGDVATLPVTDNPNVEGGAYATVPDYAKLLLMHLRGGLCGDERVLEEASVERMQEDRIATYGGVTYREEIPGYGFGWFVHRDDPGQFENRGAHGSVAWIDTELGYGVFFAIEATNQAGTDIRNATQPSLEDVFAVGR